MLLKSLTSPTLVSTKQSFDTKEEIIKFLIRQLANEGKLHSEEELYQAVIDREKLSPTGFEGGLAIPHGKSKAVKEASFAIATLQKPLSTWESIDPTNQVELIILLAIPDDEAGSTHLSLLSELVTRLSNEEYKNRLLRSNTNLELFNNLDRQDEIEEVPEVKKINKTILAVTACPAGIAHTYMAAEALVKAGKDLGVDVFVEKQGANGIEDRHTKGQLNSADAVIFSVDVAVKNEERYSHLPKVKTAVAAPLKDAKGIISQALEKSENAPKKDSSNEESVSFEEDEDEKNPLRQK
ncbi:fructose PTS transporter subunit IIA [Bacillus sp. OVS6]|nr:fructose PTS transporter subunit IIA [Bacillus sp. OVS6]